MSLAEALSAQLFGEEDERAYAVLDGASVPQLLDQLYGDDPPEFACLYHGELKPDLAEVAPYLVQLQRDSGLTQWVIEEGWGKHWGVFALAPVDLRTLRQHLRRLNIVYSPEQKPLIFRYYDPRVLRVFAPTCDAGQLAELFGPVRCYLLEEADPAQAIHLTLADGRLRQDRRRVAADASRTQGG